MTSLLVMYATEVYAVRLERGRARRRAARQPPA